MSQLSLLRLLGEDDDYFPDPGAEGEPRPWVRPREPFSYPPDVTPRWYQEQYTEGVLTKWEKCRSTLGVMATGLGKTFACSMLARKCLDRGSQDFLFLAHRRELIEQTERTMKKVCPEENVVVEMADQYAAHKAARIVVASKDTISKRARLSRFPRDRFGWIVVDECHLYTDRNKSYQDVIDHFGCAKILGTTATPDRADEYPMGKMFETLAYQYDIQEAIPDGWLVPIVQQAWHIDGFSLEFVDPSGSDLNQAQLAEEMRKDKPLQAVAKAAVMASNWGNEWNTGEGRPTLVFCASVEHAKEVAAILNLRHAREGTGSAAAVDCFMNDGIREAVIERYKRNEIRYLVNFGVLTTGFDAPNTRVIVMARPTKVRSLYAQMLGRGLRPLEEIVPILNKLRTPYERRLAIANSRKPGVLVVDLMGVSGKHKLITAVDVLGGNCTEEVIEIAKKRRKTDGTTEPVSELLKAAMEEVKAAREEKRKQLLLGVKFSKRSVSPFDLWNVAEIREPGWEKGKKATEAQIAALEHAGVFKKDMKKLSRHKASQLLDEMKQRREKGLCTYRQSKIMAQYGYNPDSTFDQASRIIDRLIRNGWRPFEVPPAEYV